MVDVLRAGDDLKAWLTSTDSAVRAQSLALVVQIRDDGLNAIAIATLHAAIAARDQVCVDEFSAMLMRAPEVTVDVAWLQAISTMLDAASQPWRAQLAERSALIAMWSPAVDAKTIAALGDRLVALAKEDPVAWVRAEAAIALLKLARWSESDKSRGIDLSVQRKAIADHVDQEKDARVRDEIAAMLNAGVNEWFQHRTAEAWRKETAGQPASR